jgi:ABC-type branched-subunit amino acid transport system ATPase component
VRENLQLGITARRNRHEMARMIDASDAIAATFPRLKERLDQEEGTSMPAASSRCWRSRAQ